jgi:hypothetical protein
MIFLPGWAVPVGTALLRVDRLLLSDLRRSLETLLRRSAIAERGLTGSDGMSSAGTVF